MAYSVGSCARFAYNLALRRAVAGKRLPASRDISMATLTWIFAATLLAGVLLLIAAAFIALNNARITQVPIWRVGEVAHGRAF